MKLVIVSGLSGSGKSIVLHSLEDLGYYCIDNLPLSLLTSFAAQISASPRRNYEHAAVGIDARNLTEDFDSFPDVLEEIRNLGLECEILFLQADDNTLIKRFSETRRKHPLTRAGISLAEAIKRERRLLSALAVNADWCIDTSHTNVHQLRDLVRERMVKESRSLTLTFLSFGFKHGIPVDADFVFDVRCLPNPHWVPQLRALTGLEDEVKQFLEQQALVGEMYEDLRSFIERWMPRFRADNRAYMTVAIGCTGGQHRSVYLARQLADYFAGGDLEVLLRHRELS
jgi:UPF0042 nucleotide-binding protein